MNDITLLRQVIAHARTNGWAHDITQFDDTPREHRWMRDGVSVSVWGACVYVGVLEFLPESVRQAVDVLVALGVLPVEFSSAYAAGQAAAVASLADDRKTLSDSYARRADELTAARLGHVGDREDPETGAALPAGVEGVSLGRRCANAQTDTCGGWAANGPCQMPAGHNMGRADIPENHYAQLETEARHG